MRIIGDYQKKDYPFPNRDVSATEKSKPEYVLSVGQNLYSKHVRNKTGSTHAYSEFFCELRDYGRGMQSTDKYKNFLGGISSDSSNTSDVDGSWTRNKTSERKGWMNVLWDILSPAPKIRNMIHGIFDDIDFDVMVDAIDADSGAEAEEEKWRLWATTRTFIRGALDQMKQSAGLPVTTPDFIPESLDELEMYEKAGGFKQAYAMALEKLIRHTDDVSDWGNIKRKLIDDIIDLGICASKADYNDDESKVKWRYVDPADLVIQYSKYEDFNDAEYAGEFKDVTISELRRSLYKEGYSEKDIEKIAEDFCGYGDNPHSNDWGDFSGRHDNGGYRYDDFRANVFVYEWIDHTPEKKIRYTNKYGKVRWLDYEGKKPGNREEIVTTGKKTLFQGNWIVGTEIVYDYGAVHYQPRPVPRKVELTYKAFKIEGKSLMAILLPILDNIQIGWLKYQNALNTIFEEGYAVDFRLLQNISDGSKKFSAAEAVKMWKETGILPYMSTPVGQYYRGGAVVPAHKLPGGMGESLNQAIMRLNTQMKLIEDMTGLSPVSLGGTPNPDAPVGTTERSIESTHNALKPMIRSVFYVKSNLGKITGIRIQQLLKYDDLAREQYTKVVGDQDVQSVILARDSGAEYGFNMEARPTQQEKMNLLRAAEIAMAPGRDGVPGIEYADYSYIVERLMGGGNLKEMRLYLVQARKKAKKEAFAQQQAMVQQQGQQNQQLKLLDAQKEEKTKQMDIQGEMMLDNNKHRNTMEELSFKLNAEYIQELKQEAQKDVQAN